MKVLASLIAAASLAAGSAAAQEARIPFGDLDLSSTRGADTWGVRVEAAALKLCRDARRPNSFIPDRAHCQAAVRQEAQRLLPATARAEYARGRVGAVAY
jgi:UrcA family protein